MQTEIDFDFHTHRLDIPPGSGIVSLPQHMILQSDSLNLHPQGLYAAGIHPWWTAEKNFSLSLHLAALERLLGKKPQIVQVGECGLDRCQGVDLTRQIEIFIAQVELAEAYQRPMTLHIVRCFSEILALKKQLRPQQKWTIHGFRGKAMLAQQLLTAGFDLSFGTYYDEAAFGLTPLSRRKRESDSF